MDYPTALLSGAVLVGASMVLGVFAVKRRYLGKTSKNAVNGVVLLHQFRRTRYSPNASPPCLKLETYLRMAKIPYECNYAMRPSKKGKMPWIEYNGQAVSDSNFCVKFLNQEFAIDLDQHLTEQERAVSHAFLTMMEENTYWTLVHYRWIENPTEMKRMFSQLVPWPFGYLAFHYFQRTCNKYMYGHGIGRHSDSDIHGISECDLRSLSNYLGDKRFLMGDKACLVDCAVFGLIANFLHQDTDSPQNLYIRESLPNLVKYVENMKEEFYPDWDALLSKRKI